MTTPRNPTTHLRLAPTLRLVEAPGVGMFLLGEGEHHLFGSALYQRLLPLLVAGGEHAALAGALEDAFHPLEVFLALEELGQRDLLAAPPRPASRTLEVALPAGRDPAPLLAALAGAGLEQSEHAGVRLLLLDSYLDPTLETEARRARERGQTLVPLYLGHAESWLGPALLPDAAPCWQCLLERLWDNHPVENFLRRQGLTVPTPPAAPPVGLALLGLGIAALLDGPGDTLLRLRHSTAELHHHRVLARPNCPLCGTPIQRDPPVTLQSRPLGFAADGGYRLEDPRASYARLADRVDRLTGLVSRLGPLPGRDRPGRPVYAATHPLHPVTRPGPEDFQQISLGKGQTPEQARMSALGEALERWSARHRDDLPGVRASLAELGEAALGPATLMNFSEQQYARREIINAALDDWRRHVPLPYPATAPLDWTPAWCLGEEQRVFIPTGFCYSQYPAPPGEDYLRYSSNGNAAGNCLEEAILQGFLELVERDAVAVWWYNRLPRPALDLASVEHPYPEQLAASYGELGWRLWCLDLTTDLNLPVVVALAEGEQAGRCYLGFGCHLEPRLALLRALTELNQLFDPDDPASRPWEPAALPEREFLYPAPQRPPRPLAQLPGARFEDLREAVRHCVTRAASLGLRTLVLDQTRPQAGLCAVKVVVPGLRHFWPRFGPGRLYRVPVALGWREAPLAEADLNPLGLYL